MFLMFWIILFLPVFTVVCAIAVSRPLIGCAIAAFVALAAVRIHAGGDYMIMGSFGYPIAIASVAGALTGLFMRETKKGDAAG
ncbi:MAG: hypothetical protein A4S14_19465 [Proteobacteria bacterium SG_bin9]|nr:MAG: hypothetical protein A4S14_19465 [Proteobacteria bacterium SG_bin9]